MATTSDDGRGARGPGADSTDGVGATVESSSPVRAYVITGGRTRSANRAVGFETLVTTSDQARHRRHELHFERAEIVDLADSPVSVAELSARLRIPLGVAQVLAGDMTAEGWLQMSGSPTRAADDVALIQRLIDGVRAL